jgi:hypothetical protein
MAAQLHGPLKTQHCYKDVSQDDAAALGGAYPGAWIIEQTFHVEPVQRMHNALVQGRESKFRACSPLAEFALQQREVLAVAVPCGKVH